MSVFLQRIGILSIPTGPSDDPVSVAELVVYTILGATQTRASAQALEFFTILGAPQTAVSAQALEMYAIVEV